MPRARKTQSGAPASPAVPAVDTAYGEGERMIESQRRMPVPAGQPPVPGATGAGSGPSPSGGAGPAAPPQDPRARLEMALSAMQRMKPPGGLTAPTQRPNEPLQAGMPFGPGTGPEALRTGDRVSRTLRLLADISDDPGFAHLADIAASRGR